MPRRTHRRRRRPGADDSARRLRRRRLPLRCPDRTGTDASMRRGAPVALDDRLRPVVVDVPVDDRDTPRRTVGPEPGEGDRHVVEEAEPAPPVTSRVVARGRTAATVTAALPRPPPGPPAALHRPRAAPRAAIRYKNAIEPSSAASLGLGQQRDVAGVVHSLELRVGGGLGDSSTRRSAAASRTPAAAASRRAGCSGWPGTERASMRASVRSRTERRTPAPSAHQADQLERDLEEAVHDDRQGEGPDHDVTGVITTANSAMSRITYRRRLARKA